MNNETIEWLHNENRFNRRFEWKMSRHFNYFEQNKTKLINYIDIIMYCNELDIEHKKKKIFKLAFFSLSFYFHRTFVSPLFLQYLNAIQLAKIA